MPHLLKYSSEGLAPSIIRGLGVGVYTPWIILFCMRRGEVRDEIEASKVRSDVLHARCAHGDVDVHGLIQLQR